MAKLTKGENVGTNTLAKICKALECDISDIMEIVPDKDDTETEGGTTNDNHRKCNKT
ncbi:hypothetical protein FACS1894188_05970 [Clostridia bacterium]|nr:hypothetical protein FACS1894188_05970 [Clostridia bacterium]